MPLCAQNTQMMIPLFDFMRSVGPGWCLIDFTGFKALISAAMSQTMLCLFSYLEVFAGVTNRRYNKHSLNFSKDHTEQPSSCTFWLINLLLSVTSQVFIVLRAEEYGIYYLCYWFPILPQGFLGKQVLLASLCCRYPPFLLSLLISYFCFMFLLDVPLFI
jgi:hypothetical protein